MHTPPVKPPESGFSEGTFVWGIRTEIQQGRLSRNKVSVGEPADGSPPKKGGLRPTLKTFAMQGKPRWFSRQFHGSLPRTKRSIERPSRARSPASAVTPRALESPGRSNRHRGAGGFSPPRPPLRRNPVPHDGLPRTRIGGVVVPSGFEPESRAPKACMIDRYTTGLRLTV